MTPYEAWYGRLFLVWPEADVYCCALRAPVSPILGEKIAVVILANKPETSDSEQEAPQTSEEVYILSMLSKRIAEFSVGVQERMILKKGEKGL